MSSTMSTRHCWVMGSLVLLSVFSCLFLWIFYLSDLKTSHRMYTKQTVGVLSAIANSTEKNCNTSKATTVKPAESMDLKSLEVGVVERLKDASQKKFILVWYKSGMSGPGGHVDRDRCGNCEITKNRSLIANPETGAVVFYYKDISLQSMPSLSTRNPDQLHIFWNKEPTPLMRYVHRKELDFEETYGFNATFTYRRDSDFYNSYRYHWIGASFNSKLKLGDILKQKSKTSVAVLSDCNWTAGARLRYRMLLKIKSLGFDMDGFGKCFPESDQIPPGNNEIVKKIRGYKFFFAFENSYHCADYITEKFYRNSLFAGAVPVVLGPIKSHYTAVAPPGSFIFLEDFNTLEELVDYLQYLDQNDTAYLEYFRWRLTSVVESSPYSERKSPFCHICRSLYGINIDDIYNPKYNPKSPKVPVFTNGTARRTVPSLKEYLFVDEDKLCMEKNETILPIYSKYKLF